MPRSAPPDRSRRCGPGTTSAVAAASEERLRGTITGLGLSSGDRIVVGAWHRSPIGVFADVMWAHPDDTRVLLASGRQAADYVAGIYRFDRVEVAPFRWTATPSSLSLRAGPIAVDVSARGGHRVPVPRPWWFTRWVEGPIARRVMGVEVHGWSPLGVEEWYQARAWRWVHDGRVRIAGEHREIGPVLPPLEVGFSEVPTRPSITDVAVRIRRQGTP